METNLKIVNFLDITFNLASSKYRPYRKPNGNLMYIQKALKDRAPKEQRKKNNRNRKVICFNPPYSKQVSTNIARHFLNLLYQHFPEQPRLQKIFNRNNVRLVIHAQKICPVLFNLTIKKLQAIHTGNIKPCNCRKMNAH